MAEGRKRILIPFTGRRKRKAWKTRETYIPLKRRWSLAEIDRGSYYKEECIDKFLDSKGAFTVVMKVNDLIVIIKIMNSISYRRGLPIIASK